MGLWLNDDFSGGSSQTCDTFANAPLASTCVCLPPTHTHTPPHAAQLGPSPLTMRAHREEFSVLSVEVWGFVASE
jgi:hypothetical protein